MQKKTKGFALIILLLLLLVPADAQRKRKKKPAPKPTPAKPLPDYPTPKNLGNCNSANFPARCSITGTTCVSGSDNQGCLLEGDVCTNCYRGSPTPQPKPNTWKGAIVGRWTAAGWEIHNPGAWGKRGLKAGDVIVSVDGTPIDSPEALLRAVQNLHKARRFRVRSEREVAAK